ncbi:hypothetical protein QR680_005164 [Steinernema hermaphroditum]|uniref:EGF-like domain-containing protein n=1 Tax=Steinernema hermaphroditum TaxID=289476 RepID=A0AA39LV71_9BILA|nr:hypothetical protein QR680_005164 [Steinernema hermaphroditum]
MDPRRLLGTLLLGLLGVFGGGDGDFRPLVRLDKGHRMFQVGSREPFYGFYTQLTFTRTRCIRSLTIDSLRPLTGAEEIDLVFSPCPSGPDDWQVAHYSNRENVYHLERDVFAHKLSVVSPTDIAIIDVGVQPCENELGVVQRFLRHNGTGLCEIATTAPPTTTTTVPFDLNQADHPRHRHRIHPHRTTTYEEKKENRENDRHVKRAKRSVESVETSCKDGEVFCETNGECVPNERLCLGTNECDFFCYHGHCDPETRSCVCDDSWEGAACDVCSSGNCPVRPVLRFLLPQTISVEQKNAFVFAHGNDFPPGPRENQHRYTCFFGGLATEGRWISPTLVRCSVPPVAYVGRHVFNVFPLGETRPIPSTKTIHFTFFLACSPQECHGFCHGPLCVCPHGSSGTKCASVDVVTASKKTIEEAKTTTAHEGVPYSASLPVHSSLSVVRVETNAEGLFVDPFRSMVFWPNPVGSKTPYNVTVYLRDASSSAELSWQITVAPTYTVTTDKAEPINGTNKFLVSGSADFRSHAVIPYAPLTLHAFQQKTLRESIHLRTNGNFTSFDHVFAPFVDGDQHYSVAVTQPNDYERATEGSVSFDYTIFSVDYQEILEAKNRLSVTADVVTKIDGAPTAVACSVDVVFPREKVFVARNSSNFTSSKRGEVGITLEFVNLDEKSKIVLLYECDDTNSFVARHTFVPSSIDKVLTAVPNRLSYALSIDSSFGEPLHLDIFSTSPVCKMMVNLKPALDPLFLIAAESDLRCRRFSAVLGIDSLAILRLQKQVVRGSFTVAGNNEHSLTVPYEFRLNADSIFPVTLTVSAPPYHYRSDNTKSVATVVVENPNLNVSLTSVVVFDVPTAISFFTRGFYAVSITAPSYDSFREIVKFTPSNSSLAVVLRPKSTEIVVSHKGILSIENIWNHQIPYSPRMAVSPNSIRLADQAAVVEVDYVGGPEESTVVFTTQRVDPSLPFNFSMMTIDYGIGMGSGYRTAITISPHQSYGRSQCNVFAVPVDFFYLVPRASISFQSTTHVVVDTRPSPEDMVHLCSDMPNAVQTSVRCNCAVGALANCKRFYQPLVSCGSTWRVVPDDTVSMHTVALFMLMKTKCAEMGVELERVRRFLKCIAAINEDCPLATDDSDDDINKMGASNPAKLINHISNIGYANFVFQKFFPQVQTLQSQTSNIPAILFEFLEQLEVVLPEEETRSLYDLHVYNHFFASIADDSEEGAFLSLGELKNFTEGVSTDLLRRWNHTVEEFSDGGFPFSPSKEFVALEKLVEKADLLKSLTRQFGEESPFSLFHTVVSRIFANVDLSMETVECARAFVHSEAREVEEQREFRVRIFIANRKRDDPLHNIRVSMNMVRSNADVPDVSFRIGPIFVTGVASVDGLQSLPPSENVSIEWIVTSIPSAALTRPASYQPLILFSYELKGKKMIQRLNADTVTVAPRRRMKLHYFVYPTVSSSFSSEKRPFTFMISIINSGYSPLRNVLILETNPWITLASSPKATSDYRLDTVSTSSGRRLPCDFRQSLGEIPSGESVNVLYNISTSDKKDILLRSIASVVSVDGDSLLAQESKLFFIHQTVSKHSFLVSQADVPFSIFLFDSKRSTISTLQQLQFLQMDEEKGDPNRRRFVAAFTHVSAEIEPGPVLCSLNLPEVPEGFVLERISHVDPTNLANRRNVHLEDVWVGEQEGTKTLNFVDDQLPQPASEQLFYEIVFGNPDDLHRPSFGQELYRIEVPADEWPIVGTELGTIGAKSPTDSKLRYHLVSNGMAPFFGVNTRTGAISLVSDLPHTPTDYCLNLIALDSEGRYAIAPLTIDAGANKRHPCVVYSNTTAVIDFFYEKDFKAPPKSSNATQTPPTGKTTATALTTATVTPTTVASSQNETEEGTTPTEAASAESPSPGTEPPKAGTEATAVSEGSASESPEATETPEASPSPESEGSLESASTEMPEEVTQKIHSISADPTLEPYFVTESMVPEPVTEKTTLEEVPTAITHSVIAVPTEPASEKTEGATPGDGAPEGTTKEPEMKGEGSVTEEGQLGVTVSPHGEGQSATGSTSSESEEKEGHTETTVVIGPDHTLGPVEIPEATRGPEEETSTSNEGSPTEVEGGVVTHVVGPDTETLQPITVSPKATSSSEPDHTLKSGTVTQGTEVETTVTHVAGPDPGLEEFSQATSPPKSSESPESEATSPPSEASSEATEETSTPRTSTTEATTSTTRRKTLPPETLPTEEPPVKLYSVREACNKKSADDLLSIICDLAKTIKNAPLILDL